MRRLQPHERCPGFHGVVNRVRQKPGEVWGVGIGHGVLTCLRDGASHIVRTASATRAKRSQPPPTVLRGPVGRTTGRGPAPRGNAWSCGSHGPRPGVQWTRVTVHPALWPVVPHEVAVAGHTVRVGRFAEERDPHRLSLLSFPTGRRDLPVIPPETSPAAGNADHSVEGV
ncbi:DUF5994 family protein [Streptomyces sp. NPDC020379]|uniref:DUF5994 family protein n=1 Tax=Streptomyces sp. NPDC020379 TaxID=3365071 RepID=UPI003795BFF5